MLEWGKHEEFLHTIAKTGISPHALTIKPDFPVEHTEYISAFNLLSHSRNIGMALGPIPLSEIEVYCRMFNVLDVELFVCVIVAMDNEYLAYHSRDRK